MDWILFMQALGLVFTFAPVIILTTMHRPASTGAIIGFFASLIVCMFGSALFGLFLMLGIIP